MIDTSKNKITIYGTRHRIADTRSLKPKGAAGKVLGKLCPCCGIAGSVFCETQTRIIYECGNGHQYETKKQMRDPKIY